MMRHFCPTRDTSSMMMRSSSAVHSFLPIVFRAFSSSFLAALPPLPPLLVAVLDAEHAEILEEPRDETECGEVFAVLIEPSSDDIASSDEIASSSGPPDEMSGGRYEAPDGRTGERANLRARANRECGASRACGRSGHGEGGTRGATGSTGRSMRESTGMGGCTGEAAYCVGSKPRCMRSWSSSMSTSSRTWRTTCAGRAAGVKGREGERETNGEGEREGGAQG